MSKPRVYIETTVPSFYHDGRAEPAIVARRDRTRQWWDGEAHRYEVVTSVAVLEELKDGPEERQTKWLEMVAYIPLLSIDPAVDDIVEAYIRHRLMPLAPGGDALHLALASHHRCDFLLTWNCRHLANANKFGHIRRINASLGLFVPALVTPLQLLGGNDGTEVDE